MDFAASAEGGHVTSWLVIPVKSLRDGKTRLEPALGPVQRRALMDQLLVHMLGQAAEYPGLNRTLVVSGCSETRARAIELGVHALEETGCGLNAAVRQAQLNVRQRGASQMLVVPCDLPLLDVEDLRQLSRIGGPGVAVIAPDRRGRGTNGLCFDPAIEFTFEFGEDSYRRHVAGAQRLGLEPATAEPPGLAFDVDTPADLAEWVRFDEDRLHRESLSAT